MRRACFLAALVLAVSCGGTPTSPSASVSSGSFLTAGAYTLTLNVGQSTTISTCENGNCTPFAVCGAGSPLGPANSAVLVHVERDGDRVSVTPVSTNDSFRMTLQTTDSTVSGTVSGSTTATNGANLTASGTVMGSFSAISNAVSGSLEGQISLGGFSCSNTQYSWSLISR